MTAIISILKLNDFIARRADIIAGTIFSLLSLSSIIFPRAIPFFYFAIALMAINELFRTGYIKIVLKRPSGFWLLLLSFAIWCAIAILWSVAPIQAGAKVLFLFVPYWQHGLSLVGYRQSPRQCRNISNLDYLSEFA